MAHNQNKPNSSVARSNNRYILMGLLTLCGAQLGQAAEIKIGVSLSIPPYVIQETNSGLELELLNQALAVKGHTASIQYLPLARTFHELREGKLDGIINIKDGMLDNVFYSNVAITYQNCAISLEANHFTINNIDDLNNKQVVSFQRASSLLGEEFAKMAKANSGYQEQARQVQQVYMLMKHRADVVVMDKNIFKYYLKQAYLEGKLTEKDLKQQAICHQIFAPTEYKFAFLSEQIRDDFNAGLKQITQDGSLVALQEKYRRLMSFENEAEVSNKLTEPKIIKNDSY
ncbi:amino acid ABC transporter substrate-binding protein [Shewanella baltica]|uniref:substrate-binding periplasmic protein n=1 Tax=Shewanella baltica TaxID=62322 RepID=UPI00217CC549|nr:transporter substrate-binding domain-containing protein [Shewanella baltica]MCS6233954.1 amino acid ABC transporter substrate-binding protein [Shewanella baltica]MCS6268538.1 amino acid ABC transporter substrate-binding protein [Shewanella baltica]